MSVEDPEELELWLQVLELEAQRKEQLAEALRRAALAAKDEEPK